MPDLTAIEYGLLGIFLLLGLVLGWLARGGRSRQEKIAINAGWQEQLAAQRSEHERLVQQNKRLMEQISENQAAHKDSKMRAQELSDALKETFERRDELQRQLKDVRGKLDFAIAQRDKLRGNIDSNADGAIDISNSIKQKDDKIFYLSRELQSWQDRVPPLVERFRIRDLEGQEIELELNKANERIGELEGLLDSNQARIVSVGSNALAGGLNASNDQYRKAGRRDHPHIFLDEFDHSFPPGFCVVGIRHQCPDRRVLVGVINTHILLIPWSVSPMDYAVWLPISL